MESLPLDLVIALLSALVGAAIGHSLYTHSPELRFSLWGTRRKFTGVGGDIFLTGGRWRPTEAQVVEEYDLRADFVREDYLYHRYEDGVVVAHGRKLSLRCKFHCQDKNGEWFPHEITGRGEYIGTRKNGFAGQVAMNVRVQQIQISDGGKILKRGISWITVFYMHVSASGDMHGYWITEDFRNSGKFSLVWIELNAASKW